jgi:hypothetical protein
VSRREALLYTPPLPLLPGDWCERSNHHLVSWTSNVAGWDQVGKLMKKGPGKLSPAGASAWRAELCA